jgi:hypothetical protein
LRRAYANALTVRERFPQVEALVLNIAFSDMKGNITYASQMHTFSASAKGFFAIACPATLCLDGGFDLDAIVISMLNAERAGTTGNLKCHGWVSPTHTASARCQVHMHYELQARYEENSERSARRR